jgi:serine-type D-Ala-D-Ala carboxypeptidase (penicillin-binding protein 5/6)
MAVSRVAVLWLAVVILLTLSGLKVAGVAGNEGRYGQAETIGDSGAMSAIEWLAGDLQTLAPLEAASTEVEALLAKTRRPMPPFVVESKAVAVIDAACGQLIYGKNEQTRLPPASLTKMMTALAAVELIADIDRVVPIDVSATHLARTTFSSTMGLEPGMHASVRDLLYGLMLPSGNDAAIALARVAAGDERSFVQYMNTRAAELGLSNTTFANPHGLDHQGLQSTAVDMALLGMEIMKNPLLAQISASPNYTSSTGIFLRNGNRLLTDYPGMYGVKIGYTEGAGHTIVAVADQGGRQIYVSVLGSRVSYVDARHLLDWAFTTPPTC